MSVAEPADAAGPGFGVVAGNPTPVELAAVAAVLSRALEELAADDASRADVQPSAWERSKRSVRSPLHPYAGAWRGFTA
ncbi:MAG: acyl-CoA carboxylase subunit epsilon [Rhodoglobus sp.]